MSLADEMLTNLANEPSVLTAEYEEEPHIVIGNDRFIRVPEELKKIAVQYDHNVETVTFDCPRYWDGYDMSKMKIYINYTRSDGLIGMYVAQNIMTTRERPNIMHFDWTLTRNVTGIYGPIVFMVCVKRVDNKGYEEIHWNSERNTEMYVTQALRGEEAVRDQYPDVYTYMLQRMDEIEGITRDTQLEIEEYVKEAKNDIYTRADTLETNVDNRVSQFESDVTNDVSAFKDYISDRNDEFEVSINTRAETVETKMDETQTKMDETMEMVKGIEELTTPEALQNYTTQYLTEHPEIVEAAVEEFPMATNADIDAIIRGTYDGTSDDDYEPEPEPSPENPGGETGGDVIAGDITEGDIDSIIGDLFI